MALIGALMLSLWMPAGAEVPAPAGVSSASAAQTATLAQAAPSAPGLFTSLPPARVLDTGLGVGASANVPARGSITVKVGGNGGVPASGVSAVTLNLQAVTPSAAGYLTLHAGGSVRPTASNLNFTVGRTISTLAVAPLAAAGTMTVYNGSNAAVRVIADVAGYFSAGTPSAPGAFGSLAPARILDTAMANGAASNIPARGSITVQVTGRGGVPASGVSSAVVNLQAVTPGSVGYLTLHAAGAVRPTASNLNFTVGTTISTLAVAPLSAAGSVTIYNGSNSAVRVIADVAGYYRSGASSEAGAFALLPPVRVLDTGMGNGASANIAARGSITLQVGGRGGVPASGVASVVLNLQAVTPGAAGYLTLHAAGTGRPTASNVNFTVGTTISTLAVAPVNGSGAITVYNGSNAPVRVIADINGYHLTESTVAALAVTAVQPDMGPAAGGTIVTVSGSGFTGATQVNFGGVAGADLEIISSTSLVITAPPGPASSVADVQVLNAQGASAATAAAKFTYLPPPATVSSLSITSSEPLGGGTVSISGTGFVGVSDVLFDDQAATFTVLSSTLIQATIPVGSIRTVNVYVVTAAGSSVGSAASEFTYVTPPDELVTEFEANPAAVTTPAGTVVRVIRLDPTPEEPATAKWQVTLTPGTTPPAPGDKYLLAPGEDVYPTGIGGLVSEVSTLGDGSSTFIVEPTDLDQIVDVGSIDYVGQLGTDVAGIDDGGNPEGGGEGPNSPQGRAGEPSLTGKVNLPSFDMSSATCSNGVKVSGSFSIGLEEIKTHLEVNAGGLFSSPSVFMWVSYERVVKFEGTAEGATTCSIPPKVQNRLKKVFLIPGGAGFTVSFGPAASFKISASGTVSLSQRTYHTAGIETNSDGSIELVGGNSAAPAVVTISGQVIIEAAIGVEIQIGYLDRVGVGMRVDGGARLVGSAETGTPPQVCFTVTPFIRASVYAYLDVWVAKWTQQFAEVEAAFNLVRKCAGKAVPKPVIITRYLPQATVGLPYSTQLTTADHRQGSWLIDPLTLPPGLSLNGFTISGNPTAAGYYPIRMTFRDTSGITATATGTVNVKPASGQTGTASVWSWGYNWYGRLSDGTENDRAVPGPTVGLDDVVGLSMSDFPSFALKSDGTLWSWGWNGWGQLGDGTTQTRLLPGPILGVADVVSVSSNEYSTLALKSDGTIWSWGFNGNGQLGEGSNQSRSVPGPVVGLADVVSVTTNDFSSFALKSDGTVWSWGRNADGQLGDGSNLDRAVPGPVVGLSDVVSVATSDFSSLAVRADGTVWSWGANGNGELGDGTNVNRSVPRPVVGLTDVVSISFDGRFSLALRADGTVWSWGANEFGQLGDGTNVNRSVPGPVMGLTDIVSVSSTDSSAVALKSDGTAWSWGANGRNQLGDGTNRNKAVPGLVVGLTDLVSIRINGNFSLALRADGTVWSWGANEFGQLGNGTNESRSVPGAVVGLSDVIGIEVTAYAGFAFRNSSVPPPA